MDLKSSKASPVLADPAPINKSRLGIYSSLLPCSQSGPSFSTSVHPVPRKKPGKLDDVRSNGWLDAMKSSSPPRKKVVKEINGVDLVSDDTEVSYQSWMIRYPSALYSFQTIMDQAMNRKLVMFLDYDGTLSPIVDDPDRAFMSADMRSAVRSVAKYFPTTIISGRSRDKVYDLVRLRELYYAGSHGMDIMFPARETLQNQLNYVKSTDLEVDEVNLFQPASEFIPMINEVFGVLVETTKDIIGAKVENHKFCASVHYRNVDENSWPVIGQYVHDVLKDYPQLRLTHGRKVLEVRPVIDWDKGKAVEFLLESLGFSNHHEVLPIYIGDDRTDEDAFRVLRKENNRGYGILVSAIPKESNAFFSLRDTSEVQYFLESLVKMAEDANTSESTDEYASDHTEETRN